MQNTKPALGEETKAQTKGGVCGGMFEVSSFPTPPAGTFETYRKMRGNPTVALARIAATAPIRAAEITVTAHADAPQAWKDFIDDQFKTLWPTLCKEMLRGLDYGFQAFEKVWDVADGMMVYRKLKPLLPEMTKIKTTDDHGIFAGLENNGTVLNVDKSFIYTYDDEAGNPYGRSRHENIRETAWHPWNEISKKAEQYIRKVAGVIPMIEYPPGESLDQNGNLKTNYELAAMILANLGKGNGVAMPNVLAKYAEDLARQGVDISQLKAWMISFLEVQGSHGDMFEKLMRHRESLMMRGWLVPERTATEGQHGTNAEAVTHGELSLVVADQTLLEMLQAVNWHLVNPLLRTNFGQQAENKVWISRSGLDPEQKAFLRNIMQSILTNPANVDLFTTMLDVDAMLDDTGLPKGSDIGNLAKDIADRNRDLPQTNSMAASMRALYEKVHRDVCRE